MAHPVAELQMRSGTKTRSDTVVTEQNPRAQHLNRIMVSPLSNHTTSYVYRVYYAIPSECSTPLLIPSGVKLRTAPGEKIFMLKNRPTGAKTSECLVKRLPGGHALAYVTDHTSLTVRGFAAYPHGVERN